MPLGVMPRVNDETHPNYEVEFEGVTIALCDVLDSDQINAFSLL